MITKDGYAVVPWGDRFVIIYNGFQLSDHPNMEESMEAIKKHREKGKPKRPRGEKKPTSKGKLPL